MAESTLAMTIDNMRTEAALAFGYNPTYASCSTVQKADIDRAVTSGYRQFLWPPQAPDPDDPRRMVSHVWSFVKVAAAEITCVADDYAYDLPDTFGHIHGHELTIQDDGEPYGPIAIVGEAEIRRLRQRDHDTTMHPKYAAIRPKAFTGASAGQRFEMIFWPTPDAAYVIEYTYAPLPDAMVTSTYPYPWGGAGHAETLRASVRAEAEKVRFKEHGVEYQDFLARLTASVKLDRRQVPRILGKNLDRSDEGSTLENAVDEARRIQAEVSWV